MILRNILIIFLLIFIILSHQSVLAETATSNLSDQRREYEEKYKAAQLEAQQKELKVSDLRSEVAKVEQKIRQTEFAIRETSNKIIENQKTIDDLNVQITEKEAHLEIEEKKIENIITNYYMEGEPGVLNVVMNSSSVSEATDKFAQYESVKDQLDIAAAKIKVLHEELLSKKQTIEEKNIELEEAKMTQETQRAELVIQEELKTKLLNDSENALASLRQEASNAKAKILEIEQKIRALSSVSNWGGQIVSSNDSNWYYTQSGNYTRLGNSPYTVDQYGCLITSMAMVAKYYGNNITPSDIASNTSYFNSGGYLMVTSPSILGVTVTSNQPINWGVVDNEVSSGHPVIASVFLPSVGQINSDGSSHFIVIKDKVGGKYLMHDPIYGQRGYDMSQIRSMRLVSN